MKMFNKINQKMVRPVGFEPNSMGNFLNKINTRNQARSPLEVLNPRNVTA